MSTLKKVVNLLLSVTSAEFGMLPPAMTHRLSRLSTWSPRAKKRWIATEPPNGLGGCRHQYIDIPQEFAIGVLWRVVWRFRNPHDHLVMTNSFPWENSPIFKNCKPSISMGHFPWLC